MGCNGTANSLTAASVSDPPGRIHGTVPENDRELRLDCRRIADMLESLLPFIWGKKNAQPSKRIMHWLGLPSGGTNQRLRAAAKVLLVERGFPIISGPKGFYLATTVEELVEYKQNLQSRINALGRDISAVNTFVEQYSVGRKQQEWW